MLHRRFGAGLDHADHGAGAYRLERRQAVGAGGVAGDDDELGLVPLEQLPHLERVALDGAVALGAVGQTGRVPQVDQLLLGQQLTQGVDDREAPDARIEDPNGLVRVHRASRSARMAIHSPSCTTWTGLNP